MIYNITKKEILSRKPRYYLKGNIIFPILLNKNFKYYDSVVIQNKKYFFTWYLKLNLDTILVDTNNKIIDCLDNKSNRKFFLSSRGLSTLVFLPPGNIKKLNIENGDQLNLNAELTSDFKKQLKNHLQGAIAPSSTFISSENKN